MTSMVCLWHPRQMAQTGRMMRVLEDNIPTKLFGCALSKRFLTFWVCGVCLFPGGWREWAFGEAGSVGVLWFVCAARGDWARQLWCVAAGLASGKNLCPLRGVDGIGAR